MTAEDLIEYAKSLHCSIYEVQCYSAKDMLRLDAVLAELNERGYETNEQRTLVIRKETEE